jgi:hypothetical protein
MLAMAPTPVAIGPHFREEADMDTRRLVIGTVVGGITLMIVGYVLFDMILSGFYAANSAPGIEREAPIVWAMALASLSFAALITYAMGARAATSIGDGVRVGAIVGFLLWFTADFLLYGAMNISNLTLAVVDPLVELVHGGIGGAAIAAVLSRTSGARPEV